MKEKNLPIIKVYQKEHGFYFLDSVNNCWWSFHFTFPDMDTFNLCESMLGWETDEYIEKHPECLKTLSEKQTKIFLDNFNKKFNRLTIYNLLQEVYFISEPQLDKIFNRNVSTYNLVDKAIKKYQKSLNTYRKDHFVYKHHFGQWYDAVNQYKKWNWDDDRIITYLIKREIPQKIAESFYRPFIDIFGECHPTKYSLLYEFYNNGDEVLMDKAVELYPNEEDIDKAYYYYIEENSKKWESLSSSKHK